jgi:hypothetical protein
MRSRKTVVDRVATAQRQPASSSISITEALENPLLFEPYFRGSSWLAARATMKAAMGEQLDAAELKIFTEVARRSPPSERVKELVAVIGRGGGKDSFASAIAAFLAVTFDPRAAKLRPGEKAYLLCLAVDKEQAELSYSMIAGLFDAIPTLRAMVKNKIGADTIELTNRAVVIVKTNSYRSVRGRGIIAVILDEVAFFRDETSRNPDVELHAAISPGLARVPGSMLVLISSAYRRAGLLFDRWKDYYGRDDPDVLVVRGSTLAFNPTFDRKTIDKAIQRDPARYGAEYNSEWRDDLSSFISRELLEAAVEIGVTVRPPRDGVVYTAACDSATGMGADSFTACIAHKETYNGVIRIVIDAHYEKRPPFNPSAAIVEIAALCQRYKCTTITGDKFAVGFVVEGFRREKIEYRYSPHDRSEAYLGFLPLASAGQLLLLDDQRAIAQFAGLVRRTHPSGKDKVDHEDRTNAHDDLSNAIAVAAVLASVEEQVIPFTPPIIISRSAPPPPGMSATEAFYAWSGHGGGDWWSPV